MASGNSRLHKARPQLRPIASKSIVRTLGPHVRRAEQTLEGVVALLRSKAAIADLQSKLDDRVADDASVSVMAAFVRGYLAISIDAAREVFKRKRSPRLEPARAWLASHWTMPRHFDSSAGLLGYLEAAYASYRLLVVLTAPRGLSPKAPARAQAVADAAGALLVDSARRLIDRRIDAFGRTPGGILSGLGVRKTWARIVRLKVPPVSALVVFQTQEGPDPFSATRDLESPLELALPETLAARAYPVWFGTNRKPIDASDLSLGFGNERDPANAVHHGVCTVDIPRLHRFGSTGTPFWQRLLRFQLEDDHLRITGIRAFADEAEFAASLRAALIAEDSGQRCVLVYLHGYNVSFEDAALRAAQLGCDLKVPGQTAFFSWPSKAETAEYFADIARVEASEAAIADFIECLVTRTGAEVVHVLAHSMGNRGFARAVARIRAAASGTGVRFGQIILAAPDVDIDLFRQLAAVYPTLSRRTTMYVSAKDRALALSSWLQDSDRAGFTPPVTIVSGIDTVEATQIDVSTLGHGYYAEAAPVLYDISDLIQDDKPPARRPRLQSRMEDSGNYWLIGV